MSMSQEEIEALMNGLDLSENDKSEESAAEENLSSDSVEDADVDSLISQVEEVNDNVQTVNNSEIDDILANIEEVEQDNSNSSVSNDDIDELLKGIDGVSDDEPSTTFEEPVITTSKNDDLEEENFDDILAGIDGIVDNKEDVSKEETSKESSDTTQSFFDSSNEDMITSKIDEGVFPLPAEKDTKVVNQLSQVANDSEEKASKIFDVLSLVLDDNNDVQKRLKNIDEFINKQNALLESLSKKFPNISVFDQNLKMVEEAKSDLKSINNRVDSENMQIFEAMELMQFHDINRQKIERVMAVIRKLSIYLNNLFEDEGTHQEIAVAKHIHGDSTADVLNDEDLESLIAEFEKH